MDLHWLRFPTLHPSGCCKEDQGPCCSMPLFHLHSRPLLGVTLGLKPGNGRRNQVTAPSVIPPKPGPGLRRSALKSSISLRRVGCGSAALAWACLSRSCRALGRNVHTQSTTVERPRPSGCGHVLPQGRPAWRFSPMRQKSRSTG